MRSELVTAGHLARRAVIYIRQSSPHQVLSNQESLRLQYALRRRALDLGWRDDDVEVIDTDLGLSGAAAGHRAGFKDLIARVTLGQVGIVLSSEVTRLTRNCSDWYPLLDLCGYKDCLIADRDGVYDPGSANGRLLRVAIPPGGFGARLDAMHVCLAERCGRDGYGMWSKARRGYPTRRWRTYATSRRPRSSWRGSGCTDCGYRYRIGSQLIRGRVSGDVRSWTGDDRRNWTL